MRMRVLDMGSVASNAKLILPLVLLTESFELLDAHEVANPFVGFPSPRELLPTALVRPLPPSANGGRDYAWCFGDAFHASVRLAEVMMLAIAANFDCVQSPDDARCSRSVSGTVRAASTVTQSVLEGTHTCGGVNEECARGIVTFTSIAMGIAEQGSNMELACTADRPLNRELFSCAQVLERIAWGTDPVASVFGTSLLECTQTPDGRNHQDISACVGEVLAASAYLGAAGLTIAYMADVCNPSRVAQSQDEGATCGRVTASLLRVMSLSAAKTASAGWHCGGLGDRCGDDVGLLAAALFGAVEWATKLYSQTDDPSVPEYRVSEASAGLSKELSVIVAKASDIDMSCRRAAPAFAACSAGLTKALASFAFLAEQCSLAVRDCDPLRVRTNGLYDCTRRAEFIGQGTDVVSRAIGNTVLDCGLSPGARRQSNIIALPRRFFT